MLLRSGSRLCRHSGCRLVVVRPESTGTQGKSAPDARPSGEQAGFRKGTGGRSSFSGVVCSVFGGTGMLGRTVINRLGKEGDQVIACYRGDPYDHRHLKVLGDLGQILYQAFDLRDEDSIREAVKYSNVVINMIGRDYETNNFSFYDVHVEGARKIAKVCREMGVKQLIHVSSLNASKNPPEHYIPGGSQYLRSKGFGEEAVRDEFPDATIVRPAVMFGPTDRFIKSYLYWWRRYNNHKFELFKKGRETYKMPVEFSDVANGIVRILNNPAWAGETFEFVGPYCYQLGELMDWMNRKCNRGEDQTGYRRLHLGPITTMRANFNELRSRVAKQWTRFDFESIERNEVTSDVLTGCPTLSDLGIEPKNMEVAALPIIILYDRQASYAASLGETPDPPLPPRYPPLRKSGRELGAGEPVESPFPTFAEKEEEPQFL